MEGIKESTRNIMLDSALELFLSKSIKKTKIKDIADHAGVGEATVYRYFNNKDNLVIQASTKLAERVFNEYFLIDDMSTGYNAIECFYNNYFKVFKENIKYFFFVYELDSVIADFPNEVKNAYEDWVDNYKLLFDKCYELGLKDGTIKAIEDKETFYYSTTHALLSLCQKLAVKCNVLSKDLLTYKEKEIKELINIILSKLKN